MLQRTPDAYLVVGPYDLKTDCLPDKASDLLAVALADLERTLLDPRYYFDWDHYYTPDPYGRCGICVAGGIMAQSIDARPDRLVFLNIRCHPATRLKLHAISSFSNGNVPGGLCHMAMARGEETGRVTGWPIRHHDTSSLKTIIPPMETLITDLRAAGL